MQLIQYRYGSSKREVVAAGSEVWRRSWPNLFPLLGGGIDTILSFSSPIRVPKGLLHVAAPRKNGRMSLMISSESLKNELS
jgi:hypothetical protein